MYKLYPWQQQATGLFQKPTHREVIWMKCAHGNEGKIWFQKYVQSLLGHDWLIQLYLKNSMGNIMQILRKQFLSTLNNFMFNDARSVISETRCYDILENIKNVCSIASKYSSEIIQFNPPRMLWLPFQTQMLIWLNCRKIDGKYFTLTKATLMFFRQRFFFYFCIC